VTEVTIRDSVVLSAWWALLACGVARAQEPAGPFVTLRGTVFDTTLRPVSGVLVYLSVAGTFSQTNDHGEYLLADVQPGRDTLQFRGMGFAPRAFRISLPRSATDTVDLGTVTLSPGPPPTMALTASVRDTSQNRPVVGAQVMLNDRVVGMTDSAGGFSAASLAVEWGINSVLVRRVGYAPIFRTFWVGDQRSERFFEGVMDAQAVDMPAVIVEGDRITFEFGRMRDFWRRREQGWGRFFTREEIDRRHPIFVSDMLRTVPGFTIERIGPSTYIRSTRAGGGCSPTLWLDGMRLPDSDPDALIHPADVEAIEIYRGGAETPAEFGGFNDCGAVVIWSR